MTEVAQRIRSFAELGPDWDSYGAQPINADVIERALRLVRAVVPGYTYTVVPCSDGGILFEGHGAWDTVDAKVGP